MNDRHHVTNISGGHPLPRDRRRLGGFGLYAAVLLGVGLFFSVAFFFPRYLRMRSGIYSLSCREIRRKIELAVQNHDTINTRSIAEPGKPVDLDKLKATGFLAEVQLCPEGGTYQYGPGERKLDILCTVHRPTLEPPAASTAKEP